MNDNFNISDVFGSLRYGRWDKAGIWLNAFYVAFGIALLLLGGLLAPLLYVNQVFTIPEFTVLLVVGVSVGLFLIVCFGIEFIKSKKGKIMLCRCIDDGDLYRSCAKVIVTTERHGRYSRPIITLLFKVNGKKYEKRNLKNIPYAEKYYYIDILYSPMRDEVFLLKMN